jgi:hypothetical protein
VIFIPYKIGVSSGWWRFDRPGELLGIPMKIGSFGATLGTTFIQVDLETTSEFFEPMLKQKLMRYKKELGMELGLHGEVGELMGLESGQRRVWEQSHLRLCETVKHAAELEMKFVNIHMSQSVQLWLDEERMKPFGHTVQVVAPDGKPFPELCEKSPAAKKAAIERIVSGRAGSIDDDVQKARIAAIQAEEKRMIDQRMKELLNSQAYKELERRAMESVEAEKIIERRRIAEANAISILEDRKKRELERITKEVSDEMNKRFQSNEYIYDMWKESRFGKYFVEYGEIGAYLIVAAHMHGVNDILWRQLCGNSDPTDAYLSNQPGFNAAVAMKYIEGHLTAKNSHNDKHLKGKSIVEWLNEKKLYLCFEIPEIEREGTESLNRLYNPLDFYLLLQKLGSPYLKLCIDFEHMIAQKMEPEDIVKRAPSDFGKYIYVFHLGKPIPYMGKAHIQIPVPSRSMEVLYRWLYSLRKKGFADGYMIYERGGGKNPMEVMQQSVWALRQIKDHLEKDIAPDELPETFYGISEMNKDMYARQYVSMREHAWDPLSGLLMIPEEAHTFLSRSAVEKGKAEEWKKGRVR